MGSPSRSPESVPSWVDSLGAPVWVSDPSGKIGYLNDRAEKLLGISAEASIGRPCHEVVRGTDPSGRPHCGPRCPTLACARRDLELEPFDLCLPGPDGTRHWVQVLMITLQAAAGNRPWLIHCAIPRDKAHRIEEFVGRVATRTTPTTSERPSKLGTELTARESQILELLAQDHSLYTIADELCISYLTVRNHVQHILSKLGVHSMMEAVARHLALRKDLEER